MKRKPQIATLVVFAGFVGALVMPRLFTANANTNKTLDGKSLNNPETAINQLPEIQNLHHTEIGLGQR